MWSNIRMNPAAGVPSLGLGRLAERARRGLCGPFGVLRSRPERPPRAPLRWRLWRKLLTVLVGAGIGLLVSFTSIGSGCIVAALLLYLYRLPISQVVGSDIVQAVFLAGAAGLAHAAGGRVDSGLVVSLLIGSIPGVLVGSALCPRMPVRALRGAVAIAILYAGVRLL